MDFGLVVSHKQTSSDQGHGSGNLKHQRSELGDDDSVDNNSSWRLSKMAKGGGDCLSSYGRSNLWPSTAEDYGQKMLSFSSDEGGNGGGGGGSSRSIVFSICQDEHYSRSGGGGLINGGIRGPFARLKGPFTPSQWMELEHQALIYKHIVANVPVPSNLLVPLKRSLYSYGLPGSYASNFLGWGPFHLGYSGSNDPEPGRCRRTDGKKWRCSRDAVPDQKYCERHINRGRHRSRKPVEGLSGHANSKVQPAIASSSSPSPTVMSSTNASNTFSSIQFNSATASTTNHLVSRSQGLQGLSLIPPTMNPKPKDVPFSNIQKQHVTFEESPHSEFGIVSSDSLLNPSERIPYTNNSSSGSFLQFNPKEANNQHPVHHFIDDWPKDQSDSGAGSWPGELKSDWTQLSMSNYSSNSPAAQEKSIPTLRLAHELEPIHMSLGVSQDFIEPIQKQQPSWLPVTWGNPMGGPLGEVLTSQLGSSPTGVLQKSTFVSVSNSSSGSSPTSGDHKKASDDARLCNDLLGSALVSSGAISSL